MDYPCRPNVCNLDAHMWRDGRGCLWPDNSLLSDGGPDSCTPPEPKRRHWTPRPGAGAPVTIAKDSPLYKLRWVTLGYHYDWDKKVYCSENKSTFPEDLAALSTFILHCVGYPGSVQ